MQTDSSPLLPRGWTAAEFEWLSALGTVKQAGERARLLHQHPEWLSPAFIEQHYLALSTEAPVIAQRWLPAAKGLVVLADHLRRAALQGYTRLQYAFLLLVQGHSADALVQIDAALPFFQQARDQVGTARAWHLQAQIYGERGDHARALTRLQQAYALYRKANAERYLPRCEYSLALLYHQMGESARALLYVERALARARRMGDSHLMAHLFMLQGILNRALERYVEALSSHQQALALFQATEDTLNAARTLANIGLVYWSMGLYAEARLHYAQAMPLFQSLGSQLDVAICLLNTGLLLQDEGELIQAEQTLSEARRLFEQMGDAKGVALCLQGLASVANSLHRTDQAQALAHQACQLFERIGLQREAAFARIMKASALIDQKRYREAEQSLARAQATLESLQVNEPLVNCLFLRGECARKRGNYKQASDAYEQCLNLLTHIHLTTSLPPEERSRYLTRFREVVSAIAGFYVLIGENQKAFAVCQRGKGVALRYALAKRFAPSTGLGERALLTSAQQRQLDALRERWERAYAQWQRARSSTERRAKQREYERSLSDWQRYRQLLAAQNARWQLQAGVPLTPEQIPLDSRTALVEYVVCLDYVAILLLKREGNRPRLYAFTVRVAQEQLTRAVESFRQSLETGAPLAQVHAEGRQLYQWLVEPLQTHLNGVSNLVICPDGVLHALAWGALRTPSGRYLTQQWTLTTAPSSTVWAAAQRLRERRPAPSKQPLLIAVSQFPQSAGSDAGPSSSARTGLASLPGVVQERRVLRNLFGRSLIELSEQGARRAQVVNALRRASLVHCATHALVNSRMPSLSALALRGQKGIEWLYVADLLPLSLQARLAVLSACSTAAGMPTGDGVLSWGWAFLGAGCPTVLATLWRLPDEATPLWMEAFYRAYRAGRTPAEAVQRANVQLLRDPRFAHPRYWAAWCLIGNGQ